MPAKKPAKPSAFVVPLDMDHGTAEQIREAVKAVVLERKKAQIS